MSTITLHKIHLKYLKCKFILTLSFNNGDNVTEFV